MKCSLVFLIVFAFFATESFAQHIQQWGELSDRSRLIHNEEIRWLSGGTWPNHQIRRTFQFPRFEGDEARMPFIGAVIVTHSFERPNTDVEIIWGGPNRRNVGLEFTSGSKEGIHSTVQIFSR